MIPALSTLKAILPPFKSFTAPATSFVTVPVLGFGIRLRGPSTLPNLPILGITEGVATITSTSVQPPSILAMYSSRPTKSAPAAVASASLSGVHKTRTVLVLPVPCGNETVPRIA
eukprot:Mycagemm_TRINITY_DN7875_c0_g2::TRINITY_DN7875_c0_g2_i1::g.2434::m.2434 type:complete len:115 gc:universal TRINITY_DN7875_c0_g2_i1:473-129(-)